MTFDEAFQNVRNHADEVTKISYRYGNINFEVSKEHGTVSIRVGNKLPAPWLMWNDTLFGPPKPLGERVANLLSGELSRITYGICRDDLEARRSSFIAEELHSVDAAWIDVVCFLADGGCNEIYEIEYIHPGIREIRFGNYSNATVACEVQPGADPDSAPQELLDFLDSVTEHRKERSADPHG